MVYENRLPVNYSFGALSTAVAISDTTLNSADFATALPPALSTSTYVPIALQDIATKQFEIVWATAHAAAATSATVVRGREQSTARAWASGTQWLVGPTVRDGILPVANRAALPSDPHIGLRCFIQDESLVIERTPVCWGWPMASLRQTQVQLIPPHVGAAVRFDVEDFDNAGGHDNAVNNTRYTAKMAGRYRLTGGSSATGGAGAMRGGWFQKNGANVPGSSQFVGAVVANVSTAWTLQTVEVALNVGDYVELVSWNDLTGGLNTNTAVGWEPHFLIQHMGGL